MQHMLYVFALFFLVACSAPPKPVEVTPKPAVSSEIPKGQLYRIAPNQSALRIVTYAKGRFGHAHVIGGDVLHGQVSLPANHHQVWFDIAIKVADLKVDKSDWRRDEGLEPEMSSQSIIGTRNNMLSEKLLHAEQYPEIRIRSTQATGPFWQPDIKAAITLAGTTREMTVPVSVNTIENTLTVTGQFHVLQTDFGIEPFTALGGILGVADKILIRFRIHAIEQ